MEKKITVRGFHPGEEQYVAQLHKTLYTNEYAWGPAFTDYAVDIALKFAAKERTEGEELFVADCDGTPVGCIMLCRGPEKTIGQLRLFAVEAAYRHCGIGSALIDALMDEAVRSGYQKLILWTASPLTAAIRQYERLGFRITESMENNTWCTDGSTLQELKMELDLQ